MTKPKIISSVSYSQDEILSNIFKLCKLRRFSLDPTYGKGVFYKHIPRPRLRFDIHPLFPDVKKADCRKLPLENESVRSIIFDPPFIGGSAKKLGIIQKRFGFYKSVPELWRMYDKALKEFHRILKDGGILVIKSQDVIESSKQYLSHIKIINTALSIGFYPKDIFILLASHRMPQWNIKTQQHARKYHCYFLVFIKQRPLVKYGRIAE